MNEDLLSLIETARGATTAELMGDIAIARKMGLWLHQEPRNTTDLQRQLHVLRGLGSVAMTPDGWMLTTQVAHQKPGPKNLPSLFD